MKLKLLHTPYAEATYGCQSIPGIDLFLPSILGSVPFLRRPNARLMKQGTRIPPKGVFKQEKSLADRWNVKEVFEAYCKWLLKSKWVYDTEGGWLMDEALMTASQIARNEQAFNSQIPWNVFLHPTNPYGNCLQVAAGFCSLLHWMGIPQNALGLKTISHPEGHTGAIVFKGYKYATKWGTTCIPYNHHIRVGRLLETQADAVRVKGYVTQQDLDTPFTDHTFATFGGVCWDPTYGIAYSDPKLAFEACEEWVLADSFDRTQTFGHAYQEKGVDFMRYITSRRTWALTAQTGLTVAYASQMTGKTIKPDELLFFRHRGKMESVYVKEKSYRVPKEVPAALARTVFTWAGFLKPRLQTAVQLYESGVTSSLRRPSKESIEALKDMRSYCGHTDVANKKVFEKVYGSVPVLFSRPQPRWSDKDAMVFTKKAIKPKNKLVGTTLQQCIAKAFKGFEGFLA